MKTISD